MKTFIRTLWPNDPKSLWENEAQRDALKNYLNDVGFYTLTGAGNSLDVYALEYTEPLDIKIAKKVLDKMSKVWYTLKTKEVTK